MRPPRLYKTEAIVLRQRRLGEADCLLTLYTPAHGKLEAKAKGVRRTTSRLAGHLQPLTRCLVQLAQGRSGEVVAGGQALESFPGLRGDLDRLSRALYAAELVDRLTPERVPGFATYRLFLETLRRLEGDNSVAPVPGWSQDLALRCFEMRLLEQSGFRPELEHCVACRSSLAPGQNFFVPLAGGAICPSCEKAVEGARPLSVAGLQLLRLLQDTSYKEIVKTEWSLAQAMEVERHLRSYIVYVLERDVKAAAFIERLRRREQAQATGVPGPGRT